MDFSIGNLVKGVVGVVAKVATAVVNAVSSVISGAVGMFASAFGARVSALSGAMSLFGVIDVDEDGDFDIDDAEEFLEEKFKLLVGAFIPTFDFGESMDNCNDDLPSNHVCYIFYQPGVLAGDRHHHFDDEARIEAKKLKKKYPGTEAILVPVTSPSEFKNSWNNMDDRFKNIDGVEIILHGTIDDDPKNQNDGGTGFLYFEHESKDPKKEYRIAANNNMVRDGFPDISIHELEHKEMDELYFSSCNSANPDAEENTASAFEDIVDANEITGWDGGTVYIYNDKDPEKSEEVPGGEGAPNKLILKMDDYGTKVITVSTDGQPTWYKYVQRKSDGSAARPRIGKVKIKQRK
ncbi:hypothetical protein FDF26_04035 [Clostridium botulinum]|nr:hypothetical protein [Clostridium botulinum]